MQQMSKFCHNYIINIEFDRKLLTHISFTNAQFALIRLMYYSIIFDARHFTFPNYTNKQRYQVIEMDVSN